MSQEAEGHVPDLAHAQARLIKALCIEVPDPKCRASLSGSFVQRCLEENLPCEKTLLAAATQISRLFLWTLGHLKVKDCTVLTAVCKTAGPGFFWVFFVFFGVFFMVFWAWIVENL